MVFLISTGGVEISAAIYIIKVCSKSGTTYFIIEIIAKANLNLANLMQNFEIPLSENTQQNSLILHTNSDLAHVGLINVCSNGGPTYALVCN